MSHVFYTSMFMTLIDKFDRLLTSWKGVNYFANIQSEKLNFGGLLQIHLSDKVNELANNFTSNY